MSELSNEQEYVTQRPRNDEEIPRSEREDTGKVNEGNDEGEVDDSATPTEVTRGGVEKHDHKSCSEEAEKRLSTCPENPKSDSIER